jgi:hypothetical protein
MATPRGTTITLSWTPVQTGGPAASYVIEAGYASGAADITVFDTGNAGTSFVAAGVGAGTYYIRVRARNAAGTSGPSNEVALTIEDRCGVPLTPPVGLRVTANSGGTVGFAWAAGTGAPTSYMLEAGSGAGASNLAKADLGGLSLSYMATGVAPGTYYVRVRAKNACGVSAPSNEVVVTVGDRAGDGRWVATFPMTGSVSMTGGWPNASPSDPYWIKYLMAFSMSGTLTFEMRNGTMSAVFDGIDGSYVQSCTSNIPPGMWAPEPCGTSETTRYGPATFGTLSVNNVSATTLTLSSWSNETDFSGTATLAGDTISGTVSWYPFSTPSYYRRDGRITGSFVAKRVR